MSWMKWTTSAKGSSRGQRGNNVPSTRLAGYRCSLPGLAGFAGVPSPGTPLFCHKSARRSSLAAAGPCYEARMSESTLVGKKAPAFSAPDQDGKTVKLSEYKGRWLVLYFYPNDDTPGCTTEACDFTNGLKDFEKLDAAVLGCSPNSERATASSSRSTSSRSACSRTRARRHGDVRRLGREGPLRQQVHRRHPLDGHHRPDGKVAHHWPRVKSAGHADAVREKLKELRS